MVRKNTNELKKKRKMSKDVYNENCKSKENLKDVFDGVQHQNIYNQVNKGKSNKRELTSTNFGGVCNF